MVPNKASISTKDELTKEQNANLIKTKDVKTTFNIYLSSNREIEINLKEIIEKISNFVKKKKTCSPTLFYNRRVLLFNQTDILPKQREY